MTNKGRSLHARLRRGTLARRIKCCNPIAAPCQVLLLSRATGHDWVSIHGDVANNRYVPLGQISLKTIAKLGAVWVSEPFADGATSRMTPIVHDSVMIFAACGRSYAL